MKKINYLVGDATSPTGEENKVICHICNNYGLWGAGFVLALSKKWNAPEEEYRKHNNYVLGIVHYIPVQHDIIVANMIAQHNVRPDLNGLPPIRYDALTEALINVNEYCTTNNASLHMPRIGTGLAGGKWNIIEKIIHDKIHVPVYVYDLY